MIEVYSGEELSKETAIKKRLMTIWYIILGVYVLATVGFFVWYLFVDYDSPMLTWINVIEVSITAIFGIYSFLFFSIPYRRQRRYVRLLNHLKDGLKEFGEGKFVKFNMQIEVREFVDFYQMITEEWSERRQDFMERKVLLDTQKPLPDIKEGDVVMYKTQGNVLIEYEVKPKEDEPEENIIENI